MAQGDAEHAAQHPQGVRFQPDPLAPQTLHQRVEALEKKVAALEAKPELVAEQQEAPVPVIPAAPAPRRRL